MQVPILHASAATNAIWHVSRSLTATTPYLLVISLLGARLWSLLSIVRLLLLHFTLIMLTDLLPMLRQAPLLNIYLLSFALCGTLTLTPLALPSIFLLAVLGVLIQLVLCCSGTASFHMLRDLCLQLIAMKSLHARCWLWLLVAVVLCLPTTVLIPSMFTLQVVRVRPLRRRVRTLARVRATLSLLLSWLI